MKTLKNIFYFLAAASLVGFTSCSDDDATTSLKGAQIFFSTESPSTVEIEKGQSSVQLSIERMNATEAISIPLYSTDESGLFSMPTEVSFNAGETSAKATINFSFDALTTDVSYPLQITIGDSENTSPYGLSTYSFNIIYPAPYTSLGSAQYTEDLLTAVYGIGNDTFPVEIQQSNENPGVYRLKNLYNVNSPFFQLNSFSDGYGTTSDYYITIDCSNPDAVTIAEQPLGFTLEGYGEIKVKSVEPGTFKEGVITFPTEGLALNIPSVSDNYPTNGSGLFKVVLPGASDVAAPAVTVAYKGSFIDAASNKSNAVLDFTLNETATSYKFAVVEGNITKDEAAIEETAGKIVDGSLESTEGTASGSVLYPLAVSGTFTVVAVPFNAEGESGATAAAAFIYSADGAPDIVQVQTGNYTVHIADAEDGYDCPLTLTAGDGFNEFLLDGIFGFEGYVLIGEYDPTSLTITFDGTVQGMEDKGPRWGYGIAYVDESQTEIYTILSNEADEPCVISVNEDGTLNAFTTSLQLVGFTAADGKITRMYEQIEANTPITKGADSGTTARIASRNAQLSTALRVNF